MLAGKYSESELSAWLLPPQSYHPYPTVVDRPAWEQLPQKVKTAQLAQAEPLTGYDWPSLPATLFLEYSRTGNRRHYEEASNRRRVALCKLVLAECIEDRGRFLDDIINGIWAICEESGWTIPAHNNYHPANMGAIPPKQPPLPEFSRPVIDLFACETGALLAWVRYLLKPRLDEVSPLIGERIVHEVKTRIFEPFLAQDGFWWMGFEAVPGHHVNNWNPWCNSNILAAFLLLEPDPENRLKAVGRVLQSLDRFLEPYPADGGCDEGATYWQRAAGSLFDCLETLYGASAGKINFFELPLVAEMGRYIYRVHIKDNYFVNFADGSPVVELIASRVYRYGQRIADPQLISLGLTAFQASADPLLAASYTLQHRLLNLQLYSEMAAQPAQPGYPQDSWLENIEVMTARAYPDQAEGFFLAVKGGHNYESHNHNDVGSFLVYFDGQPVIIDVGVENYTAKTFSPDRYTIWTMQSAFHNLPLVNGVQQKDGREFHSAGVIYHRSATEAGLSLDIAGAYPCGAGLAEWRRTVRLVREAGQAPWLELHEQVRLANPTGKVELIFMLAQLPQVGQQMVSLAVNSESRVELAYDPELFQPLVETIPIHDSKLRAVWGDAIYRLKFNLKKVLQAGEWYFSLRSS